MNEFIDSRADRLYKLLPAIHQIRDSEQGYPLKALLRVINEQVNLLEDDIERLHENSFIETADDWVVPYIADLIGYRSLTTPDETGKETFQKRRKLSYAFVTRRDVANTLRHRRRKGTLEVLELLAHDIADWPARAIEFYKLLGWLQNLNHSQLQRAQLADIRNVHQLSLLNNAFDNTARTVDVRRINSKRTVGRYNLPSIGVFVWRLKSYSVTKTQAFSLGNNRYTFNAVGLDTPLFCNPKPKWNYGEENKPNLINPDEIGFPKPLDRRIFESNRIYGNDNEINKLKDAYYSPHFKIWIDGWAGYNSNEPVPFENIKITDLSEWNTNGLPENQIAIDPCKGRIAFAEKQVIPNDVLVSYFYGFSADIGGGEYSRALLEPAATATDTHVTRYYYVGGSNCLQTIGQALNAINDWERNHLPSNEHEIRSAVIVLAVSQVFKESLSIALKPNTYLQLRAANRARPVICPIDGNNQPNEMHVSLSHGSQFVMDGILLASQGLVLTSEVAQKPEKTTSSDFASRVLIRHSTIRSLQNLCMVQGMQNSAKPSIKINNLKGSVRIEHSIVGAVQIHENEVTTDPISISISDSLVDSPIDSGLKAIGAKQEETFAHANMILQRCTIYGDTKVHAIDFAENTIFNDEVIVARRQIGCMRFCYVAPSEKLRTPKRYRCQPDLETLSNQSTAINDYFRPLYTSRIYSEPGYGQLALECDKKILMGADDESEMGVFHDLFQPQREANLRTRLEEYVPAEFDVNLIFST